MKLIVAKMAKRLAVRHSRRRKVRMNRKARRSLKFLTLGGLVARKNGKKRRTTRRGSKGGVLARLLKRFKLRKNAGYMLNRRRRARKNAGYLLNRMHAVRPNRRHKRRHSRRHAKKNTGYLLNRRRRGGLRRNTGVAAFKFPFVDKVQGIVAKFPILGSPVAKALGALAFGAAAAGAHYYAIKLVRSGNAMLPAPAQKVTAFIAPFAFSATGIAANYVLRKLPIPFVSEGVKRNLGLAAIIVGGALDMYRFLSGNNAMFGGDDYGDEYGDGGAYDVVGLGGIGMSGDMGAIGMGGVAEMAYSDAEMADAYYSGPDFDAVEGEALLSGPAAFNRQFGPPPKVTRREQSAMSRHAGRPGPRWGWLVKLVGFDGMRQIAEMDPEARCALLKELRTQALATVQARVASTATAGIGMSGIGMSGIGLSGIGMSGMSDYGQIVAGAAY
jgi:hypothetical protein